MGRGGFVVEATDEQNAAFRVVFWEKSMMSLFRNYFRFGRPRLTGRARALSAAATPLQGSHPLLPIKGQFLAIALGIFAQPLAAQLRRGSDPTIDFSFASFGWLVGSVVLAIIVFPAAYRPQAPSPQPGWVQFCVLFGAGVGWQATFDTVVQ